MHRLRPGDRRRRRTPLSPPRLRAAHAALALAFVGFGTLDGSWAARLPALKQQLALDSGELGIVIFAVALCAVLALPGAGWVASRHGSRLPLGLGFLVAGAGVSAAAFMPGLASLALAAGAVGAGFGTIDVSANAHGVALERRAGKAILSALHGMWSVGLLAGSGIAAGVAAAGASPRLQFPALAAAAALLACVAVPRLLPGSEDAAAAGAAHFALPRGALALPALLTFCSMYVEAATMNWSAVFLAGPAGAGPAVAAAGVVAFSVAMAAARFAGDPLLLRWGVSGLARGGGLLGFAGVLLAVATRSPAPALVGFALVGAGCAAIVPALFRVAGSVPGVGAGAGIAAVATAGYAGSVVNGPSIGFLARGVGLPGALGLVAAASALIALLGSRLER